jgi:multidrug efflux pump subunit AcrB
LGGYLAFTIPVSVFPSTNFPRVLIAVDNGVMPIDQMMVTITRPVEEAVNSVPGLLTVRSITSRGSAEVDLYFRWDVDMFQTLQYVNAAISRVQPELPSTAKLEAHRLTFAAFPIIAYSLTSDTTPHTKLWEMATYEMKPRLNRLDGVSTVIIQGGQEPEFHITPDPAKLLTAGITVSDILEAVRRTNMIDSPGLLEQNHQLYLGLVNGQVRTPEEIAKCGRQEHASRDSGAHRRHCHRGSGCQTRVHRSHGERKACGPAQHQPSTRRKHDAGRAGSS